VFGSKEKAAGCFDPPNRVLAGAIPRSLLATREGIQDVLTILGRIEYGVFS